MKSGSLVLVLNCGGSSIKYKLYKMPDETIIAEGKAEDIGTPQSVITHRTAGMQPLINPVFLKNHQEGFREIIRHFETMNQSGILGKPDVFLVAHKIAHGGDRLDAVELIDARVEAAIEDLSVVVSVHNPPMLAGIRGMREVAPEWPQIAVFETGFHRTIPDYATVYSLPFGLTERYGLRKFGFHGASHHYIAQRVPQELNRTSDDLRLISIHLGSGTSVAAIKGGRSLDVSSGFTPQSGTMMSTRAGDFDPEVLMYLLAKKILTLESLRDMLNNEAGLAGISGVSGGDLRDVEWAAQDGDRRAQRALEAFCYGIRKYIGAFAVALEGVDVLAFTGGIGENNPTIREKICRGMEWLGIKLDPDQNRMNPMTGTISVSKAPVQVVVLPTNEELVVARQAFGFWESYQRN